MMALHASASQKAASEDEPTTQSLARSVPTKAFALGPLLGEGFANPVGDRLGHLGARTGGREVVVGAVNRDDPVRYACLGEHRGVALRVFEEDLAVPGAPDEEHARARTREFGDGLPFSVL